MIAGSLNTMMLSGGSVIPKEPYFENVSLLLHGDGANNSTTFIDSSSNNRTFTVLNQAKLSNGQVKFGSTSMLFDGNTDAIYTADQTNLRMESNDFTFECWFYANSAGAGTYRGIYSKRNNNNTYSEFNIFIETGNRVAFLATITAGVWTHISFSGVITHNSWNHIAYVRYGDNLYHFLNGVLTGTTTISGTLITTAEPVIIGALGANGDFSFNGYIDDVRLTKGVARYTATFTLPTAPYPDALGDNTFLLLHFDGANGSTTFTDSSIYNRTLTPVGNAQISTTQSKFGGASAIFDGVGDNITTIIPPLGSVNKTIEFFVRPNSTSSPAWARLFQIGVQGTAGTIICCRNATSSPISIALFVQNGNDTAANSVVIDDNVWTHIAIVWLNGICTIYKNGVSSATMVDTVKINRTDLYIGNSSTNNDSINGFIDEFRVSNVAIYAADFTPPTAPFNL